GRRQLPGRLLDRRGRQRAIAEDEAGRTLTAGDEAGEALDVDRSRGGLCHHTDLVDVGGERDEKVDPGRGALDRGLRQVPGQRLDERVAPLPVPLAHAADVAVVGACPGEVGERELVEGRAAEVVAPLAAGQPVSQWKGRHDPAEAKPRSERLADRPQVDDSGWREGLEDADRMAV